MALKILIVPDKFKGTLTAPAVAEAMAAGWRNVRPHDHLELLPMSDGGDGFGEILSLSTDAKPQQLKTVDAAHRPVEVTWWWDAKSRTAIIDSANVIGLAMLPHGKFHPFKLDTFGLGEVLLAAAKKGARRCTIGIGGSATNDGGFGMARAIGWKFLNRAGEEIETWPGLANLEKILPPPRRKLFPQLTVAVDVKNRLLGKTGCSRIYGPQKGLRPEDFPEAERALRQFAVIVCRKMKCDFAKIPGAGAAGGLGFGLMAFLGAEPQPGFEIFSSAAELPGRLKTADLVLTGEGALDDQTLMGKGVGQIAQLCRKARVPCLAIAGVVLDPRKAQQLFTEAHGLTDLTSVRMAKAQPARFIAQLAGRVASRWPVPRQ